MTDNDTISVADQSGTQRRTKTIPKRRGSEYIDVLLRNLDQQLLQNTGSAVIGMAACESKQGLTTTAVNLAIRSADHGLGPVLLIDANAKDGKISRMYRTGRIGYGDCLAGVATLTEAVTPTKIESLDVLGVGDKQAASQIVPDMNLTAELFNQVRDQYRVTIVDMPQFKNPSPAHSLSNHLDGVVVVARSGVQQQRLIQMQQSIGTGNQNILGVVMTGGEGSVLPRWLQRWFD